VSAALEEISRIRQDLRLTLWSLVVLLLPFYFFNSGLPQPGDLLAIGLLVILVRTWNGRLPPALVQPLKRLIAFVAYVFVVNLAWSFFTLTFTTNAGEGFLLAPTLYLFNGLILFTFLLMFQRYGEFLLWLTVRLVLTSTFIQLALAFVLRRAIGRSTLMFNNPNQLGYYALLSACIILLGQKRLRLSTFQVTAGLVACSYLALLSASKAALASIAALGATLVISRLRGVVVAVLVFTALIFTDNPFSAAIEHAQERINKDQSLGFIEERGYDRIAQYPEYWFAGAGEGAYHRFRETSAIGSHELHSSMATLFFCYGIIGTLLFGAFLWSAMSGAGLRAWLVVGAALAYGMTHQGLRFRLLWLLLGMVAALRELASRERAARAIRKPVP
jgi:O-antigen ligase